MLASGVVEIALGLALLLEGCDPVAAERLAAFEARAAADPGVQQCYRTSGGPDFVLIVQVADMPAYQALAQRLFNGDAIGSDVVGQTGWGLVNAVTEYVDHRKRARNQGNRLDNAWFGEAANLKDTVFKSVLEMAG